MIMQRKIILFIVEGKNDVIEIEAIIHSPKYRDYFDNYVCKFCCINGDITSDKNSNEKNIIQKINDTVVKWRKNSQPFGTVRPSDIQEIIQIVDMDGAYINGNLIKKTNDDNLTYYDDCILSPNPDLLRNRNNRKSYSIDRMVMTDKIDSIPYSVYYVSCNMDHLLFEQRNSVTKTSDANKFAYDCSTGEINLDESIFNPDLHLADDYYESWEEIRNDTNSLKRYTNIHLFLNRTIY